MVIKNEQSNNIKIKRKDMEVEVVSIIEYILEVLYQMMERWIKSWQIERGNQSKIDQITKKYISINLPMPKTKTEQCKRHIYEWCPILKNIESRQLTWYEHIVGMDKNPKGRNN